MPKTPENLNEPMNTNEDSILTPSEIGALSPRVPRKPEMLREAPKPLEAKIYDEHGTEIIYLPEQFGDISPDTQFVKSGDRKKQPLTFRGKTKDGKIVLESENGGITISSRDFEKTYERLRRLYVERTKDGKEVKLDTEEVLKESTAFYTTHGFADFVKELPKEIKLSGASEAKLREALREGFDNAMLFPSTELQKSNVNKLLVECADKQFPGLPDTEQYTEHHMYQPDVTKNATSQGRPSRKAYLLLYQSGPIPDDTKGKTPNDLGPLFTKKKWNGFTLQEYLLLQRKEAEARKNHSFDAYSSDAKKSNWTWLLDSRVPDGVVRALWSPFDRRVGVGWDGPEYSYPRLGARPAVVVEIEV